MKKLIFCLILSALLFACSEKDDAVKFEGSNGYVASLEYFDVNGTKTALDGLNVVWSENDIIGVFEKTSVAAKYQVDANCAGSTNGSFTWMATDGNDYVSGTEWTYDHHVAVYPYASDHVCNPDVVQDDAVGTFKVSNISVPSIQVYSENSFATNSFVMAAVTRQAADKQLAFKNVCGVLRLQLKGSSLVKSLKLEGNAGEKLSGNGELTLHTDGSAPEIAMDDDAKAYVIIDCGDGVQLDENVATDFYFAIPPTSFDEGFKVTLTSADGVGIVSTDKKNVVNRSRVLKMPEIAVVMKTAIVYQSSSKVKMNGTWEVGYTHEYDSETRQGMIIFESGISRIPELGFYGDGVVNVFDDIVIPEGVSEIGYRAFCHCAIGSITFPSTLSTIGREAFIECMFGEYPFDKLPTSRELTIGDFAFAFGKESQTDDQHSSGGNIVLPSNVVSIGQAVFYGRRINNITINCGTIDFTTFQGLVQTVSTVTSKAAIMNNMGGITGNFQTLTLVIDNATFIDQLWIHNVSNALVLNVAPPQTNMSSGVVKQVPLLILKAYEAQYRNSSPWNQYSTIIAR